MRNLALLAATTISLTAASLYGCSTPDDSARSLTSAASTAADGALVGVEVDGVRVVLSYESTGVWIAALGRGDVVEKLMGHHLAFELADDGATWIPYDYYVSDQPIDDAEWTAIERAVADARSRESLLAPKTLAAASAENAGSVGMLIDRVLPVPAPTPAQPPPVTTGPINRLPPLPVQPGPINRLPPIAPTPGTRLPPLPVRPPVVGAPVRPTPPGGPGAPPATGIIWGFIIAQVGQQIVTNVTARPPALPTQSVPRINGSPSTLPPIVIRVPTPGTRTDDPDAGGGCKRYICNATSSTGSTNRDGNQCTGKPAGSTACTYYDGTSTYGGASGICGGERSFSGPDANGDCFAPCQCRDNRAKTK